MFFFFFNDTATTEIYTLSLHDALPICLRNVLVHDYSGVIDNLALESMEDLLPYFNGFLKDVGRWLEKR